MYLLRALNSFVPCLERSERQLHCFHQYAMQVESWFKAELLSFLNEEQDAGEIEALQREAPLRVAGRNRKVDIRFTRIEDDGTKQDTWLELKHWLIGRQNATYYGAPWYFKSRHGTGIIDDVEKLQHVPPGSGFILALATRNPGKAEWETGIEAFNSKYGPLVVEGLTQPTDFPGHFFLGLLKTK
jgi:hypothetical protein